MSSYQALHPTAYIAGAPSAPGDGGRYPLPTGTVPGRSRVKDSEAKELPLVTMIKENSSL
jgi:hypothetical protein